MRATQHPHNNTPTAQACCATPRHTTMSNSIHLHTLIVDDEALARQRLRTLLGDCQAPLSALWNCNTTISVTEAAHANQALEALCNPSLPACDVLLLDIHMPGQDGLQLAHSVRKLPRPPAIVFITAHPDHALSAFELDALDYLTKPVRLERLQQALIKVQRHASQRPLPAPALLPTAPQDVLLIQDRERTERVPLAEVVYFKAELKYVTVRTVTRSYIMDTSLNDLEHRFAQHFLRIHRNALVARRALRALEKHHDPIEGDGWAVRLHGVTEYVPVSRRQVSAVRETLEM